jgi:hypothetical protein
MTTQPKPTPHTPGAATPALPPRRQRLLVLAGVTFAPLFVIGWLTSGGNTPHYTAAGFCFGSDKLLSSRRAIAPRRRRCSSLRAPSRV